MKLFIDDANTSEIRRLCDLYPVDGVTTNPTILARTGKDPVSVLREIRALIGDNGIIFAQAVPLDAEGMVRDARAIVRLLGQNTIVKIPSVPEGFKAIRLLQEEGIRTCGTVVYTPLQAYLAAKSGASYVAPYVNRIDNMGYDGVGIVKQIQDILVRHHMDTEVLAASFKNSQQVLELCTYGIGSVTCAPAVIDAFVNNLAIDGAVMGFVHDFAGAVGENKSMADLIG
ncbi:MAG: fructose-6-phosphate aldolase [Clostridia bacterium]|nr:fructose-6-phosphate aldolase [Clostridia bacterium]